MPNRILKDSICTSPNIDGLSREAEVFFYRLLVQCDDYGRMDARPAILRAKCYPLQIDTVTQDSVKQWLGELVRAELVIVYTVNGCDYLQMRTWDRHQQIRAKRSKYPDMKSSDINCNQVQANVPVIQSNPIYTNVPADAGSADAEHEVSPPVESLADKYHARLEQLKEPDANKAAILVQTYKDCFGDSSLPDYGYIGKTAKQVGGAGRLVQLMYERVTNPPTGDVLAHIIASENARKKKASQMGGNREIAEVQFAMNGGDIYG